MKYLRDACGTMMPVLPKEKCVICQRHRKLESSSERFRWLRASDTGPHERGACQMHRNLETPRERFKRYLRKNDAPHTEEAEWQI